jgi:hypothetical protein
MIQHWDDSRAAEIRLSPEDSAVLETRLRAPTTEQRDVFRGEIILFTDEERWTRSTARTMVAMPRTISLWRGRFAGEGLADLTDKSRPSPTPNYGAETGRRTPAVLDKSPLAGFARWTGLLIAAELGDVREQQVWRFLRAQHIDLDGHQSWCESEDSNFVAKAADVVALYIAPPENAIVIFEKPSIRALERAQGHLKLFDGRTLMGHSHDYKRRGTSPCLPLRDTHKEGDDGLQKTAGRASHERHRCRLTRHGIHVVLDNLQLRHPAFVSTSTPSSRPIMRTPTPSPGIKAEIH